MRTMTIKEMLRPRGYRVVPSTRDSAGENDVVVEYPQRRKDAVCGVFSKEMFPSEEVAWEHAWADYQQQQAPLN